ncbi:MAG: hypothetical protein WC936_06550, partial [Candidatus Nanoarchaeia archaeon]
SRLIKSVILPKLAKSKKGTIVIDPQMEYSGGGNIFVYRLTSYADAEEETEGLIRFILANKGAIGTLIIDESNVVFNKMVLSPAAKKLVNTLRHEGVDLIAIARRPTDINITISELARERYIFKSMGVNDIKRLNEIIDGLGDKAKALSAHDYLHVINDTDVYLVKA